MKKYIIQQSKGGIGKTETAINLFYLISYLNKKAIFIDCDNRSNSLSFFFKDMKEKKNKDIVYSPFNLLGSDSNVNEAKFFQLIEYIEKLDKYDYVFMDFGAETSAKMSLFLNKLGEKTFKELLNMQYKFITICSGGAEQKPSELFYHELPTYAQENSIILNNPFFGEFKITNKIKTKKIISIPDLSIMGETEQKYFKQMKKNRLTLGELNNIIIKEKGKLYLNSEGFGGSIKKYIEHLNDMLINLDKL